MPPEFVIGALVKAHDGAEMVIVEITPSGYTAWAWIPHERLFQAITAANSDFFDVLSQFNRLSFSESSGISLDSFEG